MKGVLGDHTIAHNFMAKYYLVPHCEELSTITCCAGSLPRPARYVYNSLPINNVLKSVLSKGATIVSIAVLVACSV